MALSLRDGDRLFRLGGDEFATVLTVRDEQVAMSVAERMRKACSSTGAGTVSIGVAMLRPLDTASDVLERADRALYATKRAGRDGVTLQR
jgi:diguanylate cyclase (GGDEF)-like protein